MSPSAGRERVGPAPSEKRMWPIGNQKLVESPKNPRERSGDVFVNDELADVNALVEAPVLYDQDR